MKPLRTLATAGVVGAAALGGGLFAELFGVSDNLASGQTLMARTPSMLAAPSGYLSPPGYSSMPGAYPTPAYHAAPAYNLAPNYAPQPTSSPYGFTAYPATGYRPEYPQAVPYPYEPTPAQPSWSYVQSTDGQKSVLLGGPPLAPPQVQLPNTGPAYPGPHQYAPMQQRPLAPTYQMPNNQLPNNQIPEAQAQPLPEYAPPGYAMPGYAPPGYAPPGYAMPGYSYGAASCDGWAGDYVSTCGPPAIKNWFGSVGGLVMTRDRADHYTFSYGTLDEADQRTDTRDAAMDWTGGVDLRFGRYFNCQRNAIEAVYWGLSPVSQTTQTVSDDVAGDLNGILNWSNLDYGGSTADVYVNVAPGAYGIHQLTRDYAFQNIELNLWQFCGPCVTGNCGCSRLRSNWLVGVRYFQFNENLLFASNADGQQITHSDYEIFYNIDIQNRLLGFQVGNEAQYCVTDRLTADLGIKLGIYGNQINHVSEIGGNLGVATINNGAWAGDQFYVNSSKKDVAFLGEVNLGLRYCFSRCWTGTLGYRALAVTGVAMPADQIYPDLRGINDVANIDSSRALILHGGYAGLEYNW